LLKLVTCFFIITYVKVVLFDLQAGFVVFDYERKSFSFVTICIGKMLQGVATKLKLSLTFEIFYCLLVFLPAKVF